MANRLFCGDNLRVLREEIGTESVDLVYLDPPFNSQQDYNVLFAERDGRKAAAQQRVFEDTWTWNEVSADSFRGVVSGGGPTGEALRAFAEFLPASNMLAYLSMMTPRLQELYRVLRSTGSLFLHCDPTASHYLKIILDTIFQPKCFRNEIIWRRTRAHNDAKLTRFGSIHDVILFYSKSDKRTFNRIVSERDEKKPKTHDLYRHTDGVLYRKGDCRAPGNRGPRYEWNGHVQNWRFTVEERKRLEAAGRIVYSKTGVPRVLRPVDLTKGSALQDVWVDVDPPNSGSAEILGYPTQKPLALLERIIRSCTNEGDVVLDPFCGCGTTIEAARDLKREWVGIDITHLAIGVIRGRLHNASADDEYKAKWVPTTVDEAMHLAAEDPFQFQCWILGELGINPLYQKRGSDRGIDGRLFFFDGPGNGKPQQIMFSVKSGKLSPVNVRELSGVMKRERAQIGVLVTLEEPTTAMRKDAVSADPFRSHDDSVYPGIQLLTVRDILEGKRPLRPAGRTMTFPDAKMAKIGLSAVEHQQQLKFA